MAKELPRRALLQRVNTDPLVPGPIRPLVRVFIAVGHEEKNIRLRYRIDQEVEHGLRLGVDPVQVLEHEQERPRLALTDDQAPERDQRFLALDLRIERIPIFTIPLYTEQPEEGGRVIEPGVQFIQFS